MEEGKWSTGFTKKELKSTKGGEMDEVHLATVNIFKSSGPSWYYPRIMRKRSDKTGKGIIRKGRVLEDHFSVFQMVGKNTLHQITWIRSKTHEWIIKQFVSAEWRHAEGRMVRLLKNYAKLAVKSLSASFDYCQAGGRYPMFNIFELSYSILLSGTKMRICSRGLCFPVITLFYIMYFKIS